jgi:hypothetical protein
LGTIGNRIRERLSTISRTLAPPNAFSGFAAGSVPPLLGRIERLTDVPADRLRERPEILATIALRSGSVSL